MSDLQKLKDAMKPQGNLQSIEQTQEVAIFKKICNVTGEEYKVEMPIDQYDMWKAGEFIQTVSPQLSAEQREFIISAVTPAEWDAMFSGYEDN